MGKDKDRIRLIQSAGLSQDGIGKGESQEPATQYCRLLSAPTLSATTPMAAN